MYSARLVTHRPHKCDALFRTDAQEERCLLLFEEYPISDDDVPLNDRPKSITSRREDRRYIYKHGGILI